MEIDASLKSLIFAYVRRDICRPQAYALGQVL